MIGFNRVATCPRSTDLYLRIRYVIERFTFLLRLSEIFEALQPPRHCGRDARTLRFGEVFRGGRPIAGPRLTGGADRDRTDDLRLAKPALSQLSYSPRGTEERSVGQGRVELPTSRLSGVRSNHLSYWPRIWNSHRGEVQTECLGPSKLSPINSASSRIGS